MKTSIKSKIRLFIITCFCAASQMISQNSDSPNDSGFNYLAELKRMTKIPNSPEAEAFATYGSHEVSLYTGTPNIAVPIYTIEGKEFSLPINLSYNASGIKVNQLATNVGLGWNLTAGGMISRIVNGNVDDYDKSLSSPHYTIFDDDLRGKMIGYIDQNRTFDTRLEVEEYYRFMNDININKYDTQPDYFSINAPGISDMATWDYDLNSVEAVVLDDPKIKISYALATTTDNNPMNSHVAKWYITNSDGTQYEFEKAEVTQYQGNDASSQYDVAKTYNSSWVLTKLISANSLDVYTFEYEIQSSNENQATTVSGSVSYKIDGDTPTNNSHHFPSNGFAPNYIINSQVLKKIFHNNKEIVSINHTNRYDISSSDAISNIEIKNQNGDVLKKIQFDYNYFGIEDNINPQNVDPKNIRLKLDKVNYTTPNEVEEYNTYEFEYFSPEDVPRVTSNSQDYLGYFNGISNQSLVPTVILGDYTFAGADRAPIFNKAIFGTLSKIKYPTGGHSTFTFEPHTTPPDHNDMAQNTDDVTYGYLSRQGAVINDECNGPQALCGCWDGWCMDLWQSAMPKAELVTFSIEEDGMYILNYEVSRTSPGGATEGFKSMATVSRINSSSSCSSTPFGNIVDLDYTGNWLIPEDKRVFHSDLDKHALGIDNEMGVFLTQGCYQISIVNPNPSENSTLRVYREETTITSNTAPIIRAGFRIKEIKTYKKEDSLSYQKSYVYSNDLTSTNTTGVKIFDPHFYTISSGRQPGMEGQQCVISNYTNLTIYSNSSGGNTPHVAYSHVLEVDGARNNNNGYVKHSFATRGNAGLKSTGVPPNVNSYNKDVDGGKEISTSTVSNFNVINNQVVRQFSDESETLNHFYNFGIYLKPNPMLSLSVLMTRPYNGGYTYDFQEWRRISASTGSGEGETVCAWSNPLGCNSNDQGNPGWECSFMAFAPDFDFRLTSASGKIGGVVTETKTEFYGGLTEPVSSTTNFSYDDDNGFLLREVEKVLSPDETIVTNYKYPVDYPGISVYDNMVNDNQVTLPISTITRSGSAYLEKKTEYLQLGSKYLPSGLNITKGILDNNNTLITSSSEDRIHYTYYNNGNIKTTYQEGLPLHKNSTGYIWGYDGKYPIAVIQNAIYNDFSSFVNNLELTSNLDFDRTIGYSGTEGSLRQELDNLRNHPQLSEALITTYTYDPSIGMTSKTDPRGRTIYYFYDDKLRLINVKDNEGNILSETEYNFKVNN